MQGWAFVKKPFMNKVVFSHAEADQHEVPSLVRHFV